MFLIVKNDELERRFTNRNGGPTILRDAERYLNRKEAEAALHILQARWATWDKITGYNPNWSVISEDEAMVEEIME